MGNKSHAKVFPLTLLGLWAIAVPGSAQILIAARSLPRGAGFGIANNYQAPRSVQGPVRFQF